MSGGTYIFKEAAVAVVLAAAATPLLVLAVMAGRRKAVREVTHARTVETQSRPGPVKTGVGPGTNAAGRWQALPQNPEKGEPKWKRNST